MRVAGVYALAEENVVMLYTPWRHPGPAEADKTSSAKKRRRSTSLTSLASPSNLFKPGLTERQQMAILLQMTDPQKQTPGHFVCKFDHTYEPGSIYLWSSD